MLFVRTLVCLLLLHPPLLLAGTETDNVLWAGGLFLWERDHGLDFSAEYQARFDEDMSSLSNHFIEFMGYKKVGSALLINGGYRFTARPDRNENRLYFGGFWDMTKKARLLENKPSMVKAILQVGYQRDFEAQFDDTIVDSNSIRWVLVASKPISDTISPFLLAGVLTTWNDVYSFGVDKTRLGGGFVWQMTDQSRLRCQYIFERFLFRTPKKNSNILWLRFEFNLGD